MILAQDTTPASVKIQHIMCTGIVSDGIQSLLINVSSFRILHFKLKIKNS